MNYKNMYAYIVILMKSPISQLIIKYLHILQYN